MRALVSLYFVLTLIVLAGPASASSGAYIGVIIDGYQKDCTIRSGTESFTCAESRQLLQGDTVVKLPDAGMVKIKWAPYASGKKLDKTTILAVFEPPEKKKEVLQGVREMLGFVKTKHSVTVGATRGDDSALRVPQPGDGATLLAGRKTQFVATRGRPGAIVFRDRNGAEVIRKEVTGPVPSISIDMGEIGFRAGEEYTWRFKGGREEKWKVVRLLGNDDAKMVQDALQEIAREPGSDAQKGIRTAAFLQLISDAYPGEIDLYWLSYQTLLDVRAKTGVTEEEKDLMQELTRNYISHVTSQK